MKRKKIGELIEKQFFLGNVKISLEKNCVGL